MVATNNFTLNETRRLSPLHVALGTSVNILATPVMLVLINVYLWAGSLLAG
jgi:hypothetical protein